MSKSPLGMIDSGLGGMSIYLALHQAYPQCDIVFLADQHHAPYGSKSKDEIIAITLQNVRWLRQQGITEVLLACNTTSSNALDDLITHFPDMNFYGIIDATVAQLKPVHHVGVLATVATVQSKAYQKTINALYPQAQVTEVAAHNLVRMIEAMEDAEVIEEYIASIITPLKNVDVLILGCTHYPLVKEAISKVISAPIVDSIQPIITLFSDINRFATGKSAVYTSGIPRYFTLQVQRLFNEEIIAKQAYPNEVLL